MKRGDLFRVSEGLKHDSSIHCDELVSIPKSMLTDYLGHLSDEKIDQLNHALRIALDLEP
ncbi:MAG: type II toxin-antitoxin system PemK/MazF family toxin [Spirochaetota bacterium]